MTKKPPSLVIVGRPNVGKSTLFNRLTGTRRSIVTDEAGITPLDEELARLLRRTGKPFFVAVNKVDSPQQESNAANFHRLGVPIFPITAEHGTGVDDLLDAAIAEVYGGSALVEEDATPADTNDEGGPV